MRLVEEYSDSDESFTSEMSALCAQNVDGLRDRRCGFAADDMLLFVEVCDDTDTKTPNARPDFLRKIRHGDVGTGPVCWIVTGHFLQEKRAILRGPGRAGQYCNG